MEKRFIAPSRLTMYLCPGCGNLGTNRNDVCDGLDAQIINYERISTRFVASINDGDKDWGVFDTFTDSYCATRFSMMEAIDKATQLNDEEELRDREREFE